MNRFTHTTNYFQKYAICTLITVLSVLRPELFSIVQTSCTVALGTVLDGISSVLQAIFCNCARSSRSDFRCESMSHPDEMELHEAVLEYLTNTADMSVITMNTIRLALEDRFGCDLNASRHILKKAMHAFIENLVGKNEEDESTDDQRNTLKRKKCKILGVAESSISMRYIYQQLLFLISVFTCFSSCGWSADSRTTIKRTEFIYGFGALF